MRALYDRVEKVIGVLVAGQRNLNVEVGRSPIPALLNDSVKDGSGPMFVIDPRQ